MVTAFLLVVGYGLETTHTDFPETGQISLGLLCYGSYIGSDIKGPPSETGARLIGPLVCLGNYKYYLMAAVLIAGCGAYIAVKR